MKEKSIFNNNLKEKVILYGIIAFTVSAMVFISYFLVSNIDSIFLAIMWFINKLLGSLKPILLAFVLAYILNRPVTFIERFFSKIKFKRGLSVAILYFFIVGILIGIILFVVPIVQQNVVALINDFPRFSTVISGNIKQSIQWINNIEWMNNVGVGNYISKFTKGSSGVLDFVISFAGSFTQGMVNFILAMILAIYLLINKEKMLNLFKELLHIFGGKTIKDRVIKEANEINIIIGHYITGMLTDALIIFILDAIGLFFIGHRYFLLMAITIALLNLIPYFGSLIGGAIAVILALFQGIPIAIGTLLYIATIQVIDGNIMQPKIVGNKVGLGPISVITAVLVFGSFWGIIGMLIAVPIVALLKTIAVRFIENRRQAISSSSE